MFTVHAMLIGIAGIVMAATLADVVDRRFYPSVSRALIFCVGMLTMLLVVLFDGPPAQLQPASCTAPAGVWL